MERMTVDETNLRGILEQCGRDYCKKINGDCSKCSFLDISLEKLRNYEKAEENGMLKMLPCRIDDEMWAIRHYRGVFTVQKGFVSEMFFTKEMKLMIVVKHVARGVFGEKVFLTREAAEQALKQMGE